MISSKPRHCLPASSNYLNEIPAAFLSFLDDLVSFGRHAIIVRREPFGRWPSNTVSFRGCFGYVLPGLDSRRARKLFFVFDFLGIFSYENERIETGRKILDRSEGYFGLQNGEYVFW